MKEELLLQKNGFQQFKIGGIEAIVLTDGYFPISPLQPSMAPLASLEELTKYRKENFESDEEINLSINVLLLRKEEHLILVDTGMGDLADNNAAWLIDNLKLVGIAPTQITDILITHAHLDHIGGLTSQGKSTFPNAKIYLSSVEYDFWMNSVPDYRNAFIDNKPKVEGMTSLIRKMLSIVESQLVFIENGATILDSIKVEIVPGHTKGLLVSTVFSQNEQLVLIADVAHSTTLITHPEWGVGFDWDLKLGIQSRKEKLAQLCQDKSLVFGYHLPYPGLGHIKKIGVDSYEWIPKSFSSPQK